MSKVYSFRLDENNPREDQAREVIEAWVEEGYSLRHVIVEALISLKKEELGQGEINSIVEKLQDLILSFDKSRPDQLSEASLSNSFLVAVKQSMKSGLSSK
ncbi:hypothetical protein KQH40_00135 [bacterium]|nr:hypothetical protein [bacterium]